MVELSRPIVNFLTTLIDPRTVLISFYERCAGIDFCFIIFYIHSPQLIKLFSSRREAKDVIIDWIYCTRTR